MTTPAAQRLGCRVLDKDGEDCVETADDQTGYAEWRAISRAEYLAQSCPLWAPYTVVVITTETLHTIEAPNMPKPDVDALALAHIEEMMALRIASGGDVLMVPVGSIRALLAALREARADGERLDWLGKTANGIPVEVDAFTGMINPEKDDAVFLTQYLLADSVRLGQGRTLRAAIDAARAAGEPK